MPRFTVNHPYRAERVDANLVQFGPWAKGDEVEVDEPDAVWVNADSPGTLTAAPAKKPAATKGEKPPAKKPAAGGSAHSTADAAGLTKGG